MCENESVTVQSVCTHVWAYICIVVGIVLQQVLAECWHCEQCGLQLGDILHDGLMVVLENNVL